MTTVAQQVMQIVADVFYVSPDELSPASSPETIEAWDSLQHLNLVLALEEVFAVDFTPEEIAEMKSMALVAGIVERKMHPEQSARLLLGSAAQI
jgi:acyl carrier protein